MLGGTLGRLGKVGEARQAFSRAAQILKEFAARIEDARIREGFHAASRVRRLLEHR